jgi:hypothetical protein
MTDEFTRRVSVKGTFYLFLNNRIKEYLYFQYYQMTRSWLDRRLFFLASDIYEESTHDRRIHRTY